MMQPVNALCKPRESVYANTARDDAPFGRSHPDGEQINVIVNDDHI